jgi:hypothetical protein
MKYIKKYERLLNKIKDINVGDFVKIAYDTFPNSQIDKNMIYVVSLIDDEEKFKITITSVINKNIYACVNYNSLIKVPKNDADVFIATKKYNI